jgi:hypothetical protein
MPALEMLMRRSAPSFSRSIAVAVLLLGALPALAQETEPVNLDAAITLLRTDMRAQKPVILRAALPMTPEQSTAFWALYADYDADLQKLNDERFLLFKDYANNYQSLEDFGAEDMARRSADLDERRGALRLKYVKRFARILPGRQLARFVQIDNRLDLILNLQIAEQIPLIR